MERGRLEAFSDGVSAVAITLLFVVMVPFATGTVADYLAHGGFDARAGVAVYGGVLAGMPVGFASMFEWPLREGRSTVQLPRDQWWRARLRFTSGGPIYLAIIGLAFWSAPVAFGLSGAVAVYYVFERTPAMRNSGGAPPSAAPSGDQPRGPARLAWNIMPPPTGTIFHIVRPMQREWLG